MTCICAQIKSLVKNEVKRQEGAIKDKLAPIQDKLNTNAGPERTTKAKVKATSAALKTVQKNAAKAAKVSPFSGSFFEWIC